MPERRLIARDRELAAFADAVASVRAGVGRCVILTGEAGIGKTRLAVHALRAGDLVTYAGAARSTVAEPYSPVAQVLRACLRRRPDLPEACGPLAAHLAALLPELGPPPQDAGEETLIEALRRAFTALAEPGPVAVLLDDLHWADEATLLLLPHLAAELRQVPLLLVIAARDEVPADTHRLRRLRAQLRRVSDPVELALAPLDRDDTARLAAAVTGGELDDATLAALHDRTHGVPFYVEELAATLGLEGRGAGSSRLPLPETVLDAVLLRTEVLSLAGRNALETAAVAGTRCVVAQVPSLDAADAGLAEVLASGLLVEDGPGASRSGTPSCAMPCTTRSRGRGADRRTPPSPAHSRRRVHRPPSGRRTGSGRAIASAGDRRWPRPRPPLRGCTPTATPRTCTSGRSTWTAAATRCGSSCSSASPSARSWRETWRDRRAPGAR